MSSSYKPIFQQQQRPRPLPTKVAAAAEEDRRQSRRTTMMKPDAPLKKMEAPKKLEKEASLDINKSAEAFIQRFRQQLALQRLESIENYEQMLKRGT